MLGKILRLKTLRMSYLYLFLFLVHISFEESAANNFRTNESSSALTHDKGNLVFFDLIREELMHKAWSDDAACYNQTMAFLESAQNASLAGMWLWDTMQLPTGVLYGSRYQLGNYDECLKAPWDSNTRLRTQYCLAEVRLIKSEPYTGEQFGPDSSAARYISTRTAFARDLTKLTWGVCLPAACDPGSVANFTRILLDKSPLGRAVRDPRITVDSCRISDEKKPFNGLHTFFIVVLLLLAITVSATILVKNATSTSYFAKDVVEAFCLKRNLNSLVKKSKDDIKIIHFVKVMFSTIAVVAHTIMMKNSMAVMNAMDLEQSSFMSYTAHAEIGIAGFLVISGLLFARNLLTKDQNVLLLLVKRYFRLIGPFAVMVAFFGTAWREAGDGPLWLREAAREQGYCRDNWWLSLLMLNNYIHADRLCHLVSWYIPADFHLTLVCAMLYLVYRRSQNLAKILFCLLGAASLVVPAVTSYYYQLQGMLISDVDAMIHYSSSEYFVKFYSKSHNHACGYLIGVLGAYILTVRKPNTSETKVPNKKLSRFLFFFFAANFFIPVYLGAMIWNNIFGDNIIIAAAVFESADRLYCAINVCLAALLPHYGILPIGRKIFYWSAWAPLSKLSYGLYLIHPAILLRNIYSERSPASCDLFTMFTDSLSTIFLGFLLSLLMYLLVEAPLGNLSNLLLSPRKEKKFLSVSKENEISAVVINNEV